MIEWCVCWKGVIEWCACWKGVIEWCVCWKGVIEWCVCWKGVIERDVEEEGDGEHSDSLECLDGFITKTGVFLDSEDVGGRKGYKSFVLDVIYLFVCVEGRKTHY